MTTFILIPFHKQITKRIVFSYNTSSAHIEHAIESLTEKRTKDVYGPEQGKHLNVFIDDLNTPEADR